MFVVQGSSYSPCITGAEGNLLHSFLVVESSLEASRHHHYHHVHDQWSGGRR